jgi:hypothetical protein
VQGNRVSAVGARGHRRNVGRNLRRRYCGRENLVSAAGEHGLCQRCERIPHTRDCESESRESAVGELGYSRRPYDKSNSQQPYCMTLDALEISAFSFCEKFVAQMNLFEVENPKKGLSSVWYLQREWAPFSLPIEPINMHGGRQLLHYVWCSG